MKKEVVNSLKTAVPLSEEEIEKLIEIPPSPDFGDFAFPCFSLASKLKKNPADIAKETAAKIKSKELRVEVKGAYINFFVKREKLAENLVQKILKEKESFGRLNIGKGEKALVEFSQTNTHKAFHVGHIRGTSIGESLSRIYEFIGKKVIRANYNGDTGMHIAKWIWCYKKYHPKEKLKDDESWIASIYVDAARRLAKNKKLQKEVDIINKKLEDKSDNSLNRLWEKTRILSIKSWKKIYKELNTKFDVCYFESEMEKPGKEIAKKLLDEGIAKESEGAVIIDLNEYHLGVWVLLRTDETVLYSAKDLALAKRKYDDYGLRDYLVVVGDEQKFYFQQLKKILELMDAPFKDKYNFITFGMVRLPTGKMSSRTGENVLYSDFIEEIKKLAEDGIKKREPKISKKELNKRALLISIAAIKYSMLKQDSNKTIIFNPKESVKFEGDTGPYLQYSYARASSILRKAKRKSNLKIKIDKLDEKEFELIKKLNEFPEVVLKSYQDMNPSHIANYSYQLAKLFNEFYHVCPVINSEKQNFRLSLVEAFRIVLKNSLNLLGIDVLEEM